MTTLTGHKERLAALEEHARARRDGKDGQLIVQADDAAVRALKEELATLKAHALQPDNDSKAIPIAIGRLGEEFQKLRQQLDSVVERLIALENEPKNITPAEPAELQENINALGRELGDMSAAILQHIVTLQKRADAQDARFAELPTVLAQLQRERRAG